MKMKTGVALAPKTSASRARQRNGVKTTRIAVTTMTACGQNRHQAASAAWRVSGGGGSGEGRRKKTRRVGGGRTAT
jgi:hypothetical protein